MSAERQKPLGILTAARNALNANAQTCDECDRLTPANAGDYLREICFGSSAHVTLEPVFMEAVAKVRADPVNAQTWQASLVRHLVVMLFQESFDANGAFRESVAQAFIRQHITDPTWQAQALTALEKTALAAPRLLDGRVVAGQISVTENGEQRSICVPFFKKPPGLLEIPPEVLREHVGPNLSARALLNLSRVNKQIREAMRLTLSGRDQQLTERLLEDYYKDTDTAHSLAVWCVLRRPVADLRRALCIRGPDTGYEFGLQAALSYCAAAINQLGGAAKAIVLMNDPRVSVNDVPQPLNSGHPNYLMSVLHSAVDHDNFPLLDVLFARADLDVRVMGGARPGDHVLHTAVTRSRSAIDVLNYLWKTGRFSVHDINAQDAIGATPLCRIAHFNRTDKKVVDWLLRHGADWAIPDHKGRTPKSYLIVRKKMALVARSGITRVFGI